MTDELITPITQMHVHGIEYGKKIGYNTHILKIKMLILSHFGTPLPPKKMPPPPWTFQDMPLPRTHNSFTTLLLLS